MAMAEVSIEGNRDENRPSIPSPFSRLWRRGVEWLHTPDNAWNFTRFHLLPGGVVDELNQKKGMLGLDGIVQVSKIPGWEAASLYLFVKGLESTPETQRRVLQSAVSLEAQQNPEEYTSGIKDLIEANVSLYPKDLEAKASKLFQVNRQGPDNWLYQYQKVTEKLDAEFPTAEVFVLMYASLIGLEKFAEFARRSRRDVNLLVANWYQGEGGNQYHGYKINSQGRVEFLPGYFQASDNVVIIDDTVNKWRQMRQAFGRVRNISPDLVVVDPSKAIVVCKTSPDSSCNPDPIVQS